MSGAEIDAVNQEVQFISPDEGTPAYEALAGKCMFYLNCKFNIILL